MGKRIRNIEIKFRVTSAEQTLIQEKMRLLGTTNMAAYLRKMAINGRVLVLDTRLLRDLLVELNRQGNNLNQITKMAHETGSIYATDIEELRRQNDENRERIKEIIMLLTKVAA